MTMYVFMNFKKMIYNEDDSTFTEVNTLNLNEFGEQKFSETNMFMFHVLRKQKSGAFFLTEETARHVDIKYVSYYKNYDLKPDPEWVKSEEIPAKHCELADFKRFKDNNDIAEEYFESWSGGYSLICPETNEINLQGTSGSMLL